MESTGEGINQGDGGRLNPSDMLLLGVGVIIAVFFWITIGPALSNGFYRPYPGSFLVKWIPTGMLVLLLYRRHTGPGDFFIFCGLLLQSLGAVIIDFDRLGNVLPALITTALGHCLYITAFVHEWRKPRSNENEPLSWVRRICMLLIILYAAALGAFLLKNVFARQPLMSPAIIAYMIILPSVALTALLARKSWIAVLGGICFLLQDSLFGWHLYVGAVRDNYLVIWPLYYGGQVLLTAGYLRGR